MSVRPKKIMIVDDNEELLEELQDLLNEEGYQTSTFTSGVPAAREARQSKPDLILLDLKLEGKSGFLVATELTRVPGTAHIPILGMTGYYSGQMYALLMNIIGFQGCLAKPIHPGKLLSRIEELLEGEGDTGHISSGRNDDADCSDHSC